MGAERYRFHCTDGRDAVFDRIGKRLKNAEMAYAQAESMAREMMAGCGGRLDWSGWIVDVHDAAGRRVLTLDFRDVRSERQAA
ncbi:DUF6894 family protein [Methylobacterium sp. A54F]